MGFGYGLPPDAVAWTVLAIGRLGKNGFWGEEERVRSPWSTCTLIRMPAGLLIVDPSVPSRHMPRLLHAQAGVRPEEIRYVFLTHFHLDHCYGLRAFPQARWLMADLEIGWWRERASRSQRALLGRIAPAENEPLPGLGVFPTPGHTPGLSSLLFCSRGKRIAVAGDAVLTEDHFRAREVHAISTDANQARASIDLLTAEADIIVPGHDVPFPVS